MFDAMLKEVSKRQELFDAGTRRWVDGFQETGGRIFCTRGCRHCCSLAVHATFPEALLVADALTEPQSRALDSHVSRLMENLKEVTDLKTYLRMHRREIGFCPFLDGEGACGIYPRRPFSCRALLSTRPGEWCGVELADLDPWDRELYLKSLDPEVVSYPTHYAAVPQERGLEQEKGTLSAMLELCGFTLSGNLAVLVFLERTFRLSSTLPLGYEASAALLARSGLDHPLLLSLRG